MKLSFKTILPLLLISALLILFNGCMGTVPDESPGYTPGTTTITGIIAAPCCSTSSTVISEDTAPSDWCLQCAKNWFLQKNIAVILTYEGEEIASTTTNAKGEYTFSNLSVGENYVITAICPDDGGKALVKDLVKKVIEGEDYDAGITDCESTALGLIVDALVNLGISSEYIILEDIQGSAKFKPFIQAVCEVLEKCGDVTSDDNVLDQGNLVLMEVLGDNPGWTGGEVICVFNPPDNPCLGVPPPTANAGPDQSFEVCLGGTKNVNLTGSGSGKGTISYSWNFGNGGSTIDSTTQNPQNIPFAGGVYNVVLTVTDDCGSSTDTMVVTITELPAPTANAGPDQSYEVCPGTTKDVDFTGSGSGTGALSYAWDLDNDGQFDDSTAQDPQDVAFGEGTHAVTLQVTDQCSSTTDTMVVTITESAGVTADAGEDQEEEVCPGTDALIDLDGSGSGTGALS
ncbi:MAG TPA: PKD domain-containing protein, partial [Candidatus Atribacteria bacterium]|nr:PKD domain-containing protein [Candidatus Atribacteria bacterium]